MIENLNHQDNKSTDETILKVNDLKKWFPVKQGIIFSRSTNVKAVDGVSFEIKKGETLGLVGESGCGKSTVGRTILRLIEPTSGNVIFDNVNLQSLNNEEMRKIRKDIQIIFQDPFASLNPRMTVGDIVSEPFIIHGIHKKNRAMVEAKKLLEMVGVRSESVDRYPHEFSGGQRQRICIARILAVNPKLIICDESVSALDVSIQAQILNLMVDLQKELGLTYLFISHDLSVVKHISDRVAVMYLGKTVEIADKKELFANPTHPYTKALISAIPMPDPDKKKDRIFLKGDIPSPMNIPSGCPFHTRCYMAEEICRNIVPEFTSKDGKHFYSCHLV
jgi:oligopeptide/dipeptide ABC transporter ATP-binding protein